MIHRMPFTGEPRVQRTLHMGRVDWGKLAPTNSQLLLRLRRNVRDRPPARARLNDHCVHPILRCFMRIHNVLDCCQAVSQTQKFPQFFSLSAAISKAW